MLASYSSPCQSLFPPELRHTCFALRGRRNLARFWISRKRWNLQLKELLQCLMHLEQKNACFNATATKGLEIRASEHVETPRIDFRSRLRQQTFENNKNLGIWEECAITSSRFVFDEKIRSTVYRSFSVKYEGTAMRDWKFCRHLFTHFQTSQLSFGGSVIFTVRCRLESGIMSSRLTLCKKRCVSMAEKNKIKSRWEFINDRNVIYCY